MMGYKGIFGHFLFVLAVLKCHWFVSGTTSWTQQQKLVQDDDGKPLDIDTIDDAAIQAKVKEIEEAMHGVSAKLYEAASAEMAEQEGSGDDGNIDVGTDDVVDADFEVVDED